MISIDITVNSPEWDDEKLLYSITQKALIAVTSHLSLFDTVSELSLLFTNDEYMTQINAQWRKKNYPTNVLSFPAFPLKVGQKPGLMLGDIILARETIAREAEEGKKSFHDHLTHMIVHGILHLLGYDHETNDEAHQMEELEKDILQKISIKNPYTELP
ncbi:rRNA maturation RNase YbeY [Bartonella ancashensis]|uniref:Endoribonuclease YbeY n=1 Tax=Bartonella ancashensis TaxID=1318743 RepID=A0A0M4M5N3_9HYPH|nr:rRNA maturation RNase YbeY [Bartonella ancashensis]ALE03404.1 Metal-dependent hydrolase YbeY, involved in rRNA and/or ribosome maturation and assembly [Bartonella ancashensis]